MKAKAPTGKSVKKATSQPGTEGTSGADAPRFTNEAAERMSRLHSLFKKLQQKYPSELLYVESQVSNSRSFSYYNTNGAGPASYSQWPEQKEHLPQRLD
ncbi:hypothetical protein [Botryobacter ruber]|uniref:hypothetical protein n=1 Tax=Botryobacter ruber TaxID=2171629 RepID=UPI001478E319|nr:hypothetical protein [Botryobacter ruber]